MSRHRRHSVYGDSSNLVVSALRDKIKLIEDDKGQKIDMIDPERFGAIVHQEQILVNKKTRTIRKAYMIDHRYKIGWVVDWDINNCMVCLVKKFIGKFKISIRLGVCRIIVFKVDTVILSYLSIFIFKYLILLPLYFIYCMKDVDNR